MSTTTNHYNFHHPPATAATAATTTTTTATVIESGRPHPFLPSYLLEGVEDGGGGSGGSSSREVAAGERQTEKNIKIHFNSSFNVVKYGEGTDIKGIIGVVTSRQSGGGTREYINMFALRLRNAITREVTWLHHDLTMQQVESRYPNFREEDVKLELRVRYILDDLHLLYTKDRHTFNFLYEQVKNDYLEEENKTSEDIDFDTAIQLACIEIKRMYKHMNAVTLDKKSNLEHLEREVGLHKFLPSAVISTTKPKTLRKAIQSAFKKFAAFSESECHFRYLEILGRVRKFDVESFRCALGSGWSIPVTLLVGPSVGISYKTDSASTPQHMARFEQIQSVETILTSCENHRKALVQFKVAGTAEALSITCPSIGAAESLADLVDGYCRLVNHSSTSLWSVAGSTHSPKREEGGGGGGGGIGGGGGGGGGRPPSKRAGVAGPSGTSGVHV